jgi:hypothetical protein
LDGETYSLRCSGIAFKNKELLATHSSDAIYLFDVDESKDPSLTSMSFDGSKKRKLCESEEDATPEGASSDAEYSPSGEVDELANVTVERVDSDTNDHTEGSDGNESSSEIAEPTPRSIPASSEYFLRVRWVGIKLLG